MKRIFSIAALVSVIIFSSCGSIESEYSYIPGDAVSVGKIDLPAIAEESNINKIIDSVNYDFIKGAMGLIGIPDIISDRSKLGIDFGKKMYFFKMDTAQEAPSVVMFWIKESDSLVNFISAIDKSMFYNDEGEIKKISFGFGTILFKEDRAYFSSNKEKSTTSKLQSIFDLEASNSLEEKQPEVVDYLDNENDIAVWADQRNLFSYENPLALTNREEAVVKKSIAAINFDRGEVDMTYSEVGDETLRKIYKTSMEKEFDEKILLGMPKGELPGLITLNLHPEAHRRQLSKMNLYQSLAKSAEYNDDKAKSFESLLTGMDEAFSGSSVWSIMGITSLAKEEEGTIFSKKSEKIFLNWHIAIELNDTNLVDSLLTKNSDGEDKVLEPGKTYFTFPGSSFPFYMAREDNRLYITNDETHIQKLMAKELTMPGIAIEMKHEIENNPVFASMSPQIWSWMQSDEKQDLTQGIMTSVTANALFAVDKIYMRGRQTDDAALEVEVEMKLKNRNKNALELLITSLFEKMSFSSLKGLF